MDVETMREQGLISASDDWARLIGARVGNYVIERPLARGGMGAVFVARHPTLGREVAVKFLDRELNASPSVAQRFLEEARVMAALRHPNIVEIFDFGEIGGRFYYVMELLRGVDLETAMSTSGRFRLEDISPYVSQICAALETAHAAGIVHRDLKPGNVFVLEGTPTRLKLMDFGVAKMLHARGSGSTMHGQILGTPSHMAPEQALGHVERIAPQTDLYALGAILYQMITGARVFEHPSELMLMMMHVNSPVRPMRDIDPHLPEELARVVEECLAKDPGFRPRSAAALAIRMIDAIAEARRPDEQRALAATQIAAGLAPRGAARRDPSFGLAATAQHPRMENGRPPVAPTNAPPVVAAPAPANAPPVVAAPAPAPAAVPANAPLVKQAGSAAAVSAVTPSPAELPPESVDDPSYIDEGEEEILNKLLARAQRKGDFPAFVRNVTDISNKADLKGDYSACHLGDAILKDYALTAKLLRAVNSSGARTAGKIHSVKAAVVMLGFQRVRSLALSISVFSVPSASEKRPELRDSAIRALVSGEIARALSKKAGVEDAELAMVCATFRGLGRHVVLHCLPDLHAKAQGLVDAHGVSLDVALKRVLGLSVEKLGIGIARKWRLPDAVVGTMAAPPDPPEHGRVRDQDRLGALAVLSNELCDAVVVGQEARAAAIEALARRFEKILRVGVEDVPKLFAQVRESLESRYASLLGVPGAKDSRYLEGITAAMHDGASAHPAVDAAPGSSRAEPAAAPERSPAPEAKGGATHAEARDTRSGHDREKVVAPFLLQRISARSAEPDGRAAALKARTIELVRAADPGPPALVSVLEALVACAAFRRAVALVPTSNKKELVVLAARGEDAPVLESQLSFPLATFGANDLFASALNSGRPIVVDDAFHARTTSRMPRRYYELMGSPAFMIQPCSLPHQRGNALLLCDLDSADRVPGPILRGVIAELCGTIAGPRPGSPNARVG